jgi:hypothetical protein
VHNSRIRAVTLLVTLLAVVFLIARDLSRPGETPQEKAARENQERQIALEKALTICRGIKRLYQTGPVQEPQPEYWMYNKLNKDLPLSSTEGSWPENHPQYVYLRKRCLDSIENLSREAFQFYCGKNPPAGTFGSRSFVVYVVRELLERGCLYMEGAKRWRTFTDVCHKEAFFSGVEHDPEHPEMCIFKCAVVFRPGCEITEKEIAPLVEAVIKSRLYKVAILPPLTITEERGFLQRLRLEQDE